ncbi:MAG: Hpt domain-containing protein, partial [Nitrospinota bacterium]
HGPQEAGGERGVDARALEDLRRAMGEEFGHIVGIFLDQGRERIEALRKAADRADAEALRRTAHTLKGSAGLIGAAAMASICRELQEMGSRGETAGAEALIERLADEFARVEGLLERERERVAPSAS